MLTKVKKLLNKDLAMVTDRNAGESKDKKEFHMLGIRINPNDRDKLFDIAKDENRSVSGLVRELIKRKINNWERKFNAETE